MQDKSIQRLRHRLKSIGCTAIKLYVDGDYVHACFYFNNEYYSVYIHLSCVDSYPGYRYMFYV